jgi:hypothetical protein
MLNMIALTKLYEVSVMNEKQLARQRERRQLSNNANTKRYEKTKKGKLMRMYRNMLSRIDGVQKKKAHLYAGKQILTRDEFYEWALSSVQFHELFDAWEKSNYDRRLSPSVDRVNSSLGYTVENMEWVTHSENSRRGALSQIKQGLFKIGRKS